MNDTATPRYAERRKLLTVRADAFDLARRIRENLLPQQETALRGILSEQHPADLADAMQFLSGLEEQRGFQSAGYGRSRRSPG